MPTGLGLFPFGTTPYGVGSPAPAPSLGGNILTDPATGESTGSLYIDPITGDYVLDGYGRLRGMDDVKQLVLLSVKTTLGSAGFLSLGNTLKSIDRITSNIEQRVDSALRECVRRLTDAGLIEVVGIDVQLPKPGTVFARFRWRNLLTNSEDVELLPLTR